MKVGIGSLLWKVLAGALILFLVLVAVKDWAPNQTTIEKTVVYGSK